LINSALIFTDYETLTTKTPTIGPLELK